MSQVNRLDGSNFFKSGHIPIYVTIAQHNTDSPNINHTHSFYEFVYIDRGFSTHFFNQTTTLLTPGDVFGMRPGDIHGYVYPKNTILYNCLFNLEALGSDMEEITKLPALQQILDTDSSPVWQRIRLGPAVRKDAVSYLERMRLECEHHQLGWEIKLKGLLMEFLVLFSRSFHEQCNKTEAGEYRYTQYMYKALEYIEEYYTESILVEEIAAFIGLSTDYFSRMFKQYTGLTPVEYIRYVRLAKAAELLQQPDISIADVATKVGFEDQGYFSRQFKQVMGVSPSTFQRENQIL
ncbi:MAG: AraC family transcriptional regulator [Clostridiales bacterium]|nr:AraC family transcriptional regulator [Clostridiales bacterium]